MSQPERRAWDGEERRSTPPEPISKNTPVAIGLVAGIMLVEATILAAWWGLNATVEANAAQIEANRSRIESQSDASKIARMELEVAELRRSAWMRDDERRWNALARQTYPGLPSLEAVMNVWERIAQWPTQPLFPLTPNPQPDPEPSR